MNASRVSRIALALLLAGSGPLALAADADLPDRGPVAFEQYDADNDGGITEREFNAIRARRMEDRAGEGRPMRNAGNAPGFADLDTDGNGTLSREELQAHHRERMEMRQQDRMQRQPGMGPGGGMGMGKGQGSGMGN